MTPLNMSQRYWKDFSVLEKLSKKIYLWHNCLVSYKLLPANTFWHTKPTQCAIFLDLLFNTKALKALDSHIPKKAAEFWSISWKYDDIHSGLSKFSYCSHTVLFFFLPLPPDSHSRINVCTCRFQAEKYFDWCIFLEQYTSKSPNILNSFLSAYNPEEQFTHLLIIFHCPHTLLIVACGYLSFHIYFSIQILSKMNTFLSHLLKYGKSF